MGRGLSPLQVEILKLAYANRERARAMDIPDEPARDFGGLTIPANAKRTREEATSIAEVLHHIYGWKLKGWRDARARGHVFGVDSGKPGDRVSARRAVQRLYVRRLLDRHGANNSLFHITEPGVDIIEGG